MTTPTLEALRADIIRRSRAWTPVRIKPLDHEGPEAVAEVVGLVASLLVMVEDYWPTPGAEAFRVTEVREAVARAEGP